MLRSCYQSSMRLYPDRPDVLTAGRWYFADDAAPFFPGWQSFGSRIWDNSDGLPYDPPIGEVSRGAWSNGKPPQWLTRGTWCGSHWEDGVPYALRPGLLVGADGWPVCCPHVVDAKIGLNPSVSVFHAALATATMGFTATVKRSQKILTSCASFAVPSVLFAHFSAGTGCSAIDGKTFTLTYSPTGGIDAGWYSVHFLIGTEPYYIGFSCFFEWRIQCRRVSDNTLAFEGTPATSGGPPLDVTYTGISVTIESVCVLTSTSVEVKET